MSDAQQQGWPPRDPTEHGLGTRRGGGKGGGGRAARKARRRRSGWRRIFPTWRMLLGAFLFGALVIIGGFIAGYTLVQIPAANVAAVAQSNVYLYEDGSQLARDGEVNRENVPLSHIPKSVRRAVLAAEDRDFYNEPAIDPQGMVRAAWNTATGKGTQGGSTITQQYVKNYYLAQEQTVVRKGKEFFIAIKLNREESKAQILEGYLNTSYFGRNAYGIQAAAQAYYSKDVQDIDTAEGAFLAALLNAPSAYDVALHPENTPQAEGRWNYVLDGMVKEKWLSPPTATPWSSRCPARPSRPPVCRGSAATSCRRSRATSPRARSWTTARSPPAVTASPPRSGGRLRRRWSTRSTSR